MIPLTEEQKLKCRNPVKAIRQKCLDCSGWYQREVELCPLTECPLYPFRFGKNPFRTKVTRPPLSEERKAQMRETLRKAREKRFGISPNTHTNTVIENELDEDES